MKRFTVAILAAAQLLAAAQPALGAGLTGSQAQQAGMFAGFRLRVPLDGEVTRRPVRAGLTVAPTLQTRTMNGEIRTRFGEGLELGVAGDRPLQLSFAGTPVSRLAQGQAGPDGERSGVSTLGWIAIGVGALVTAVVIASAICLSDDDCIPSE